MLRRRKPRPRSPTMMEAASRAPQSRCRPKTPAPPRTTAGVADYGGMSSQTLRLESSRPQPLRQAWDEWDPGAMPESLVQPLAFQERNLDDVKAVSAPAAAPFRCETSP